MKKRGLTRKVFAVTLALMTMSTSFAFAENADSKAETECMTDNTEALTEAETDTVTDTTDTATEEDAKSDTLVVCFSCTGTTKGVAEKIVELTDADFYEILAADPYTEEDRNWHDDNSRTSIEQNDETVRPEIGSEELDLEGYKMIFIGYPIWWGQAPRIMDTFVESYDFEGITLVPFCTSGSSGIGKSGSNLAELAGSGDWLEGQRFAGSVSEEELQTWVEDRQSEAAEK